MLHNIQGERERERDSDGRRIKRNRMRWEKIREEMREEKGGKEREKGGGGEREGKRKGKREGDRRKR